MSKVNLGRRTKEVMAKIPLYQKEFYSRLYESPKRTRFFDSRKLLNILTLGACSRLARACASEIDVSSRILQFGCTYGNQIDEVAAKTGVYGSIDLVDVSLTQLRHVKEKYCYKYPFIKYINQDAVEAINDKYDVVICHMLFHELPLPAYVKAVNNALDCVKPGGKAVFIDYHNIAWWNPIRYIAKYFNRLYQPFAEKMWDNEIRTYVKNPTDYYWRKTTYFGRTYQKVVVTKKDEP